MIDKMTAMRNPLLSVVVALLLVTGVSSFGQTETTEVVQKGDVVQLRPDHPDRYVA